MCVCVCVRGGRELLLICYFSDCSDYFYYYYYYYYSDCYPGYSVRLLKLQITVLFANRNPREILLRDQLEAMRTFFPKNRIRLVYVVEGEEGEREEPVAVAPGGDGGGGGGGGGDGDGDARGDNHDDKTRWTQGDADRELGRIDAHLLRRYVDRADRVGAQSIFVCGPPAMMRSMCGGERRRSDGGQGPLGGLLRELGYRDEQVVKF